MVLPPTADRRGRGLLTLLAAALEENLRDTPDRVSGGGRITPFLPHGGLGASPRRDGHLHVIEARHLATGRAEKMGVVFASVAIPTSVLELEPPDVIAQLDPDGQPSLRQLREIPVDRGAVIAEVPEGIGNLGMRQRARGGVEMLENGHPRRRTAEARFSNACPHGVVTVGFGRPHTTSFYANLRGAICPSLMSSLGDERSGDQQPLLEVVCAIGGSIPSGPSKAVISALLPHVLKTSLDALDAHDTFTPRPTGSGQRIDHHNMLR